MGVKCTRPGRRTAITFRGGSTTVGPDPAGGSYMGRSPDRRYPRPGFAPGRSAGGDAQLRGPVVAVVLAVLRHGRAAVGCCEIGLRVPPLARCSWPARWWCWTGCRPLSPAGRADAPARPTCRTTTSAPSGPSPAALPSTARRDRRRRGVPAPVGAGGGGLRRSQLDRRSQHRRRGRPRGRGRTRRRARRWGLMLERWSGRAGRRSPGLSRPTPWSVHSAITVIALQGMPAIGRGRPRDLLGKSTTSHWRWPHCRWGR